MIMTEPFKPRPNLVRADELKAGDWFYCPSDHSQPEKVIAVMTRANRRVAIRTNRHDHIRRIDNPVQLVTDDRQ